LITQARRGDLHSRRLVAEYLLDPRVVKKLVEQIAPALKDRTGGYTRITKTRVRPGDAAELSIIELVKE
jgi:large subunit ribosomal protein L17